MVFFLLAGLRTNPMPNDLGVSDSLIFPAHDQYQNQVYKPKRLEVAKIQNQTLSGQALLLCCVCAKVKSCNSL